MSPDTPPEPAPDYRDTLHLPQTDFPMRAGLPKREPEWLARWDRIGVYDRLRERAEGREPFTLHDGPPYANGHLHIGHALNKVLKDMVVRSQQMMGRDARYVPGWDCHGLPIEWKIEEAYRAKGRDKDQVPVVEFRRECREFAAAWVAVQREEFRASRCHRQLGRALPDDGLPRRAGDRGGVPALPDDGRALPGLQTRDVVPRRAHRARRGGGGVSGQGELHRLGALPCAGRGRPARRGRRGDLDHDALDDPVEPRRRLPRRHRLRPLRGHRPAGGVLGAHRRPLRAGR